MLPDEIAAAIRDDARALAGLNARIELLQERLQQEGLSDEEAVQVFKALADLKTTKANLMQIIYKRTLIFAAAFLQEEIEGLITEADFEFDFAEHVRSLALLQAGKDLLRISEQITELIDREEL